MGQIERRMEWGDVCTCYPAAHRVSRNQRSMPVMRIVSRVLCKNRLTHFVSAMAKTRCPRVFIIPHDSRLAGILSALTV